MESQEKEEKRLIEACLEIFDSNLVQIIISCTYLLLFEII